MTGTETFAEIAAKVTDPVEWAALMLTKVAKPGITRGAAMDAVKEIIREAISRSLSGNGLNTKSPRDFEAECDAQENAGQMPNSL